MDTNKIQVIDDNGNEMEFDVLFTFENDELGKKYVLYYDATQEQPQVFASIYDDNGALEAIEDPKEWEMIEEVFSSFVSQDEEEEHGCCGGHGGCHHDEEDHECGCQHDEEDHECCGGHGHSEGGCCQDK